MRTNQLGVGERDVFGQGPGGQGGSCNLLFLLCIVCFCDMIYQRNLRAR